MKRLPIFIPCFCIGIIVSFAFPFANTILFFLIGIIFLLLSFYKNKSLFLTSIIISSISLGLSYGFWQTQLNIAHRLSFQESGKVKNLSIQVMDTPQHFEKFIRFRAKVVSENENIKNILLSDYQKRQWQKGEIWQIQTRLISPIGTVNSSGFHREAWALSHQIDAVGSIRKNRQLVQQNQGFRLPEYREKIAQRIQTVGKNYPQGMALISALTVGKTEYLTHQQWQNLRRLGIIHLVSISGLHIGGVAGITALFILLFFRFFSKKFNIIITRHPKIISILFGLIIASIYAILAGFSIPTQRSLMMIAIVAISFILKKYFTVIKIWQFALLIILLFNTTAVLTVGFWLSFGLTLAIIAYLNNRVLKIKMKKHILFMQTQYAAVIASIVPLGLFFSYLPIISPISNSIFIPLFSIILVPFSLLAMILPFDFPLLFVLFIAEHTMNVIHLMSDISPILPITKSPILLIILSFIATIILLLPRGFYFRSWAIMVLLIFVFFPIKRLPENNFQATVYDVGQGLSVLIQTKNHLLLFDTGKEEASQNLISSLYADGVRNLNMLVLSHNDNDHDGGKDAILAAFNPQKIATGEPSRYDFATQHCMGNQSWQWDGVWFEWLTPTNADDTLDGNDKSCVLRIVADGQALLIMGDLSQKYEQQLVEIYGNDLYSQVLILGHHGSKTSSSSLFLDTVQPDVAIASAGFANAYFHPHPSVLKRLNARHISVYRTDYQGALRINNFSGSLKIEQVKQYHPYWQQKPVYLKN